MNQLPDNLEFSYTTWRTGFLRTTLIGSSVFGFVALFPAVLGAPNPIYAGFYIGLYLILLAVTILPIPDTIKAGTLDRTNI